MEVIIMMVELPESPNFRARLVLDIKKGGGPKSQFYLIDIGSCWKNNGLPCDGDVLTDVTRYSEMIINPETTNWRRADNIISCPPYHLSSTGEVIYINDISRFPYSAYHLYCGLGNANFAEKPVDICDPSATRRSKKSYSFYLTLSGLSMDTLKNQEMAGLGTLDIGNLMSELFPVGCIFTRISSFNK